MHCEIAFKPELKPGNPTVFVTGAVAGVDSAWEHEKLNTWKIFENAVEYPASSADCVWFCCKKHLSKKTRKLLQLLHKNR